jgi:hypothetical protein
MSKTAPWQELGVVENQTSTKENISKLIEFRQAVYEKGMLARRDALFNLARSKWEQIRYNLCSFDVTTQPFRETKAGM